MFRRPGKLSKTRGLELPFFEGLSQVVRRTLWDSAVQFLHPYFPLAKNGRLAFAKTYALRGTCWPVQIKKGRQAENENGSLQGEQRASKGPTLPPNSVPLI